MTLCRRFYATAKHSVKRYDVIVSGGGLIGTATACLLSQSPFFSDQNILLIESSKSRQWSLAPGYSNRVSSINEGTKKLMEKIGAWDIISEARFKKVMSMKVWDGSGAKVEFQNKYEEPIAYVVENDVIINAILKQLKMASNVTILYDSKVEQYILPEENKEEVILRMKDGSTISCDLLVGSDGANSEVRKSMGIHYLSWEYGQSAVVATLELQEGSRNDIAWQKFLETGPIALLPLTDELCSLVWSTTPSEAKTLVNLPSDSFIKALSNSLQKEPVNKAAVGASSAVIKKVFGKFNHPASSPQPPSIKAVQDGSRAMFPLGFGHASSYVKPSVAIIGDAAHRVHPLAGQGVNLGFGDVTCLVHQLEQAVQLGQNIGNLNRLKEYERLRQIHNVPLMVAIDLMARVYSSNNAVLQAAGNIALHVANNITPIKALMMSRAAV